MAHFGIRNTMEGHSIIRPPLFDSIPLYFWKTSMSTFLQSGYYHMWTLVQDSYSAPFHSNQWH